MDTIETPLQKAVNVCGGQKAFAARLTAILGRKVKQQHVWNWLNRSGVLPPEFCKAAERATREVGAVVTCIELRPDVFTLNPQAAE